MLKENVIFFVEEKIYRESELNGLVNFLNEDKKYKWINQLALLGFLTKDVKGNYIFKFVGLIIFEEKTFCFLPKYYIKLNLNYEKLLIDFSLIYNVLKIYGKGILGTENIHYLNEDQNTNLSQADYFIKNYLDAGLYNKQKYSLTNSGEDINWQLTVDTKTPMITRLGPIYLDIVNNSREIDNSNLIRKLHKSIIYFCYSNYNWIFNYELILDDDLAISISDLGSIDSLKEAIRRELQNIYVSEKIFLLKKMLLFFESRETNISNQFQIYGTSYFSFIWEKVCSNYFRNEFNQKFIEHIPKPEWIFKNGNSITKETLRPDIVSTFFKLKKVVYILDAKYYFLCYSDESPTFISGNPGISDVSKQFLYEFCLPKVVYENNSMINAFLFPQIQDEKFKKIMEINFPIFRDRSILVITISPNFLFQRYIRNTYITIEEFEEFSNLA